MRIFLFSLTALALITLYGACSKASLVGSDLFVPDSIDLIFEDNYEVNATTERVDSIVTFDGSILINTVIVGQLEDPTFGETKAEAFVDLRFGGTSGSAPNFEFTMDGSTVPVSLDSVVLVLEYNQDAFYGDTTAVHDFEVRIVDEEIARDDTLYSSNRLASTELIGSKSFVAMPNDSLFVLEAGDTTTTGKINQFRMRLDDAWVQAMIDDTSLISSAENFLEYAPALHLTTSTDKSSAISFNFASSSTGAAPDNSIYVYYTDSVARSYRFSVNGVKHNYYEHNYEVGEIDPFIGNTEKGDSLIFLQGMSGSDVNVDLPVLASDEFDGFLLNKMELEFFVLEDASSDIHDPIENLIVQAYSEDGEVFLIEDAILSLDTGVSELFDGALSSVNRDGVTLKRYSAIITSHAIQEMNEETPDIKLRIVPRNKTVIANRSIIFGPKHSTYPMKLKANYSK